MDDCGKAISKGLSRARLGNTDNVATRKSHRPALGLNVRGGGKALCLHLIHHVAGKSGFVKCFNGLGDTVTRDRDMVLSTELFHFMGGSVADAHVFLIERLFKLGEGFKVWGREAHMLAVPREK